MKHAISIAGIVAWRAVGRAVVFAATMSRFRGRPPADLAAETAVVLGTYEQRPSASPCQVVKPSRSRSLEGGLPE